VSSILLKTQEDTMTVEQMQAELDRLKSENEKLKRKNALRFKVTEKGGLSVYGLGRFPTTLYRSQWERLLADKESIISFIQANSEKLTEKGEKEAAAA